MKELLENIIDNANNEKKSGRFKKYEFFETEFSNKIKDKKYFKNKIPILVNGLSIDEKGIRDGLDPYSNSFLFSIIVLIIPSAVLLSANGSFELVGFSLIPK